MWLVIFLKKGLKKCAQMRISARKVSRYCTFLFVVFLVNIWISYNVNVWSFTNLNDRGKVHPNVQQRERRRADVNNGSWIGLDAGEARSSAPRNNLSNHSKQINLGLKEFQKRSKSVTADEYNDERSNLSDLDQTINSNSHKTLVDKVGKKGSSKIRAKSVKNGHTQRAKSNSDYKRNTELHDIFISVKTTNKYHKSRVDLILKTWYLLAKDQVC